jgi:hypothetical protein
MASMARCKRCMNHPELPRGQLSSHCVRVFQPDSGARAYRYTDHWRSALSAAQSHREDAVSVQPRLWLCPAQFSARGYNLEQLMFAVRQTAEGKKGEEEEEDDPTTGALIWRLNSVLRNSRIFNDTENLELGELFAARSVHCVPTQRGRSARAASDCSHALAPCLHCPHRHCQAAR